MIKLAVALFMTSFALTLAMAPLTSAVSAVFALFVLLGIFVVAVASFGALKSAAI